MLTTRKIEKGHWRRYFDAFTERFLGGRPEYTTVEVMTPEMGVQIESRMKPMVGLTYDVGDDALEVAFPEFVHRIYHPKEIHVAEDEEGNLGGLKVAGKKSSPSSRRLDTRRSSSTSRPHADGRGPRRAVHRRRRFAP
jgi:hypothetical protein